MDKENKINAILNIVANKEPDYDILEFVELDGNGIEIKKEIVKIPTPNLKGSKIRIGAITEYYESTKTNLLKLIEYLHEKN